MLGSLLTPMHVTDEFVEAAMAICFWAVPVVMAAGAAWPIFFPPRIIRSWPYFTRPLLGVLVAEAAVYVLLYGVVRPLIDAQVAAHHGNIILDYPVDMLPPIALFVAAIVISYFLFGIHAVRRLIRQA
ncbi:MAG: hypothetical protein EPO07_08670 [Verrucomicrobia bacterium]|nr:MAG: hypothetical protein EPO07_08670 [Verrucomicrobiota bacterium]